MQGSFSTSDVAKILQMRAFRSDLAKSARPDKALYSLLLEIIAAIDASSGAIYLLENQHYKDFGNPDMKRAGKTALAKICARDNPATDLLIDEDDRIAAALWHHGQLSGIVCICDKQLPNEIGSFSNYDRCLLIALAATASLVLEKKQIELQNKMLLKQAEEAAGSSGIIGNSPQIIAVLKKISRFTPQGINQPVLITGESGTGKDLVANAIHQQCPRSDKPFIALNCSAIPENLFESELFGHVRGAFTGAITDKKGQFELANGGTIFLDEIGEMPLLMQPKLLRALDNGRFLPVGGKSEIETDFQLVAATNTDLLKAVDEDRFRGDLYFRLAGYQIDMPPLRDRLSDMRLLVNYFLADLNRRSQNKYIIDITPRAIHKLQQYHWPGNVRQLISVITNAYLECDEHWLDQEHFVDQLMPGINSESLSFDTVIPMREAMEEYVMFAHRRCGGQATKTMRKLGIDHRRLMRYLGERVDKKITLPMVARTELVAIEVAEKLFKQAGISEDQGNALKRAMIEAIINAVEHCGRRDGRIEVQFAVTPRKFQIIVSDQGQGFQPSQLKPVRLQEKLNNNRLNGWGIYLMRKAVEEVDIKSNENGTAVSLSVNRKT